MTTVLDQDDAVLETVASEDEDRAEGTPLYRIVSYPSDPTLEVIKNMWERAELTIPPFQRGFVWTHPQSSKLIESFLLGLPVPEIFTYKEPDDTLLVIDGQQRLRTICGFFAESLPGGGRFYLKGVDPRWEGKLYSTLEEDERRRFRVAILRMVTVEQLDPADNKSVYHIFERLNTGGTGLTPQEVRNEVDPILWTGIGAC